MCVFCTTGGVLIFMRKRVSCKSLFILAQFSFSSPISLFSLPLHLLNTFRILLSNVVELFPLLSLSLLSFFLIIMMEATTMHHNNNTTTTTTTTFYCYVSVFSTDHIAQISLGKLSHPTELRRQVLVRNTLLTCLSSERAQEESWLDACFDELCDDELDDQEITSKTSPPPPPQPMSNHSSQQLVLALPIYRHHHPSNSKQPAL